MNKEYKELSVMEPGAIAEKIFIIRKHKVMLDFHLATLYEVPVKRLNEQVKRNIERFPGDFMFQLSYEEVTALNWSQIATSSQKHRRRDSRVYAFTEHRVAMLSSVLHSPRAVQMNIFIMRAFVKIRELLATNKDLAYKIDQLEKTQSEHDENLAEIYSILKTLIDEPVKKKPKIGFQTDQKS